MLMVMSSIYLSSNKLQEITNQNVCIILLVLQKLPENRNDTLQIVFLEKSPRGKVKLNLSQVSSLTPV